MLKPALRAFAVTVCHSGLFFLPDRNGSLSCRMAPVAELWRGRVLLSAG